MKEKTLSEHLLDHLKKHEGTWVKKVSLYVVADEFGYSPETAGRVLRDLAKDKPYKKAEIKVEYYDSNYAKHLAQYSYKPENKKKIQIEVRNGIAYQFFE